jgi:hypothetical protein
MSTFTKLLLTATVAALTPLVTVCLPLLSRVGGKTAKRDARVELPRFEHVSPYWNRRWLTSLCWLASRGPGYTRRGTISENLPSRQLGE